MTALHDLPAQDLLAAYRQRTLSPVEVTQAVLAHMERWEPHIRATYLLVGRVPADSDLVRDLRGGVDPAGHDRDDREDTDFTEAVQPRRPAGLHEALEYGQLQAVGPAHLAAARRIP